jgi:hypothetical protein
MAQVVMEKPSLAGELGFLPEEGSRRGCGLRTRHGGMAAFERTLSRWEYPETSCLGDCPVR